MVSVQHLLDQCRHRTTVVFGNLGQWPDRVKYYESEYTYAIFFEHNFVVRVPRSFGKTVIVFTSHLDLTWDKGVDLKFFRVGRSPSRQVWEAYQPENTEAYPLDLTRCTRLADVYVTWLTWFDDWEMHRDENLPWRVGEPIELSIASDPQVITVNQAGLTSKIHERLVHAPLPVEYLPFCVRGKLSLMVVKGTKHFPRALKTLPEFNDDIPNSLHVSDCTILPICQIPAAV
ncbi:uncharacterized protein TNCV_3563411 [Trichonephila clavipes]|nr:uncharacterized protein TNCV_3563411 [Trichonephila clavipes]